MKSIDVDAGNLAWPVFRPMRQRNQTLRLWIRQGLDQYAIDHAEVGACRSDPDRDTRIRASVKAGERRSLRKVCRNIRRSFSLVTAFAVAAR